MSLEKDLRETKNNFNTLKNLGKPLKITLKTDNFALNSDKKAYFRDN